MIRSSFNLSNFTREMNRQLNTKRKQHLLKATMAWHEGIVEELGGPRSGRLYKVPGTGSLALVPKEVTIKKGPRAGTKVTIRYNTRVGAKEYTASSPGEAPAVRLGQLRQSYQFRVVGPNYMERGEVGSGLDRSIWLEKGTKKMAARPHVKPAYDRKKPEIFAALGKRLD